MAKPDFQRSRAEEMFKQPSKTDKKFVSDKENAVKVEREKIAKLKALRLAKEASEAESG